MRHLKQVDDDSGRLESLDGIEDDVWVLGEVSDEGDGVLFREEREVCSGEVFGGEACFAGDGAEAGVGVLEVRAGVAFEGRHCIHIEGIIIDSVFILVAVSIYALYPYIFLEE
jgi:hypothetical protein